MKKVTSAVHVRRPASDLEKSRRRLTRNWGINDAEYATTYKNDQGVVVHCPVFLKWREMIGRCTPGSMANINGCYDGCTVAEEWKYFSVFQEWADKTYQEGDCLDKDMLVPGNKEYCPEFCILIPHRVNMLVAKSKKLRGKYPLGVSRPKRGLAFQATISNGSQNHNLYLGMFKTAEEASEAYNKAKGLRLRDFAEEFSHTPILSRALIRQAKLYESGAANHTCHFEKEA